VVEREPNLVDGDVEAVVGVNERVLRPEKPVQLVARHELPRPRRQPLEDAGRLFLKAHARRAVARDFTGVGVEPESAEPNRAIAGDHRLPRERRYYNVFANTDSLQVLSIE